MQDTIHIPEVVTEVISSIQLPLLTLMLCLSAHTSRRVLSFKATLIKSYKTENRFR